LDVCEGEGTWLNPLLAQDLLHSIRAATKIGLLIGMNHAVGFGIVFGGECHDHASKS